MLTVGQPAFNSSLFENGVNIEQRNDNTDRDEWRLCRTMNTQWIGQAQSNWCWVTCAKMVAESYGYGGRSIEEAVINEFGSPINKKGTAGNIANTCHYLTYGALNFSRYNVCSEGILRLLLDDGHPIVLCFNNSVDGGHAVVAYGYYYDGNTCRFLVRDPDEDGELESISRSEMLTRGWENSVANTTGYCP